MPINPRTKVTLLRISASLFALAGTVALVTGFLALQQHEHGQTYMAQAAIYFSACTVFLSVARIKERKAPESGEEDSSDKSH